MHQHTPGPWKVEHSGYGDATVIGDCGWKHNDGTPFQPEIIRRTTWGNARLIAAAPAMIEAVEKLSAFINNLPDGGDHELVEMADVIIQKVAGKTRLKEKR